MVRLNDSQFFDNLFATFESKLASIAEEVDKSQEDRLNDSQFFYNLFATFESKLASIAEEVDKLQEDKQHDFSKKKVTYEVDE